METEIKKIIKQVLYNPQVSYPPISYGITDFSTDKKYISKYMDETDFHNYLERLEQQLVFRLKDIK